MMVSLLIEQILTLHRCIIVGPFDHLESALEAAQHEAIDVAVLDVNLNGVKVYPVAEALEARSIPFLLVSGYGRNAVPVDRPHWPICDKPFRVEELVTKLVAQLNRPEGRVKSS